MKHIDRYVVRSYLFSLLVCLVSLVGLYVVIDLFQKINSFLGKAGAGGGIAEVIFRYYLWQVPFNLLPFLPVVTLAGAVFTLARLAKNNELVPMKGSGISLFRVMLPMFAVACGVSALMFAVQEWFVPRFARQIQASRTVHLDDVRSSKAQIVDASPVDYTLVFYCARYNAPEKTMYDVRIDKVSKEFATHLSGAFVDRVVWEGNGWHIYGDKANGPAMEIDFVKRSANAAGQARPIPDGELLPTCYDPSKIALMIRSTSVSILGGGNTQFQTWSQLKDYCDRHPRHVGERVALYQRVALPLSNLILFMLGVSFALKGESRSVLVGIGTTMVVCLLFYGITIVCQSLGSAGNLEPFLAAALPLVAFAAVAIYNFDSIPT